MSEGWYELAELTAEGGALAAAWLDAMVAGAAGGHRDVAGSYLAAYLAEIVVEPVVTAVLGERRGWPVAPADLAVHRHADGWFDGLAVGATTIWVLPDDPLAGRPGTVVHADADALHDAVAAGLVAALGPWFAAVRAIAPYGRRGMWGGVADSIASGAMRMARADGNDQPTMWNAAAALIDRVSAHAPELRVRPGTESVTWSGGTALVPVKGTCCLYYKTYAGVPDRTGEGYCISCPLRRPASRGERWAAWLPQEAG